MQTATNAGGQAAASNAVPDIIDSSGAATDWITFARWTAEMAGMDVITIPVFGRDKDEEKLQFNAMSGQDSKLKYVAVRPLPQRADYKYRLKRLPDMEPVDVLEWPAAANGFSFLIRTHTSTKKPFNHGFELQVGLPADQMKALFGSSGTDTNVVTGGMVALTLLAFLLILALPAPCTVKVSAGSHTILLELPGYSGKLVHNWKIDQDKTIYWSFQSDPRMVSKTFSVQAKGKWTSTGIKVAKGDQIIVEAEGKWACGSKKEDCGPDGYPNTHDFFHYYANPEASPRQVVTANYGALLMKIGETGSAVLVGKNAALIAQQEGVLFFDINETDYEVLRRDNSGAVIVKLKVAPP